MNEQYETFPSPHKFLFIGGLHRSGTTILFRSLRKHPQISGFRDTSSPKDEGQHLQTVFRSVRPFGGAGLFGFHEEASLNETSPLVTDTNREQLFDQWARYWDLEKPVLLEKSPPNLLRTRFLQALFPRSYFIILMRHPVATTLATKRWRPRRLLVQLFEHWFSCYERFLVDSRRLDHVLLLQYERFVSRPETVLKEICDFIEIAPPLPAMEQDIRRGTNEKYFRQWREMEKNIVKQMYLRYMVRKFEARANHFGYSLKHLADRDSPVAQKPLAWKGR